MAICEFRVCCRLFDVGIAPRKLPAERFDIYHARRFARPTEDTTETEERLSISLLGEVGSACLPFAR